MLPTYSQIESLHRKYAPNDEAFEFIFTHCKIIAGIAEQLLAQRTHKNIDAEFVRAGCLLHDIGAYKLYGADGEINHAEYIRHGILGYDLLKSEGFDEDICRIASRHTGAGVSKQQIITRHLPLPKQDYFAETPEERLVMYADKFHSKTTPQVFNAFESYKKYVGGFGDKDAERRFVEFAEEFGYPLLQPLAKKYNQKIV